MPRISLPEGETLTKTNIQLTRTIVDLLQFFGVSQAALALHTDRSKQLVSKWSKGERGARQTEMKALVALLIETARCQQKSTWEQGAVDPWYDKLKAHLFNLDEALLEVEKAYASWLRAHIKSLSNFIEQDDTLPMTPTTRIFRQRAADAVNGLRDELSNIWQEAKLRNRRLRALYNHDQKIQSLDDLIAYIPTALEMLISMLTKTDAELEVAPPPE